MAFRHPLRTLLGQAVRFGLVGAVGLIVNLTVFNALRVTVLAPEVLHRGPLYAAAIAAGAAIATNWAGNRYWAFGDTRSAAIGREAVEFLLITVLSLGIPLACLWVSHYVLGYTSLLADNIANNLVGLIIGSAFRFVLYRWWVFAPQRSPHVEPESTTGALALPPRDSLPE